MGVECMWFVFDVWFIILCLEKELCNVVLNLVLFDVSLGCFFYYFIKESGIYVGDVFNNFIYVVVFNS